MPEETNKTENAYKRGLFEGEALASFKDIKISLVSIEKKLEGKANKEEMSELKEEVKSLSKWRYISTGGGAVIGWILSTLN